MRSQWSAAVLGTCALLALSSVAAGISAEQVISRNRKTTSIRAPGRRGRGARPRADTVVGLTADELKLFEGGLLPSEVDKLLDSYLDRIAAQCYEKHYFSAATVELLEGDRTAKEIFLTALDPRYDNFDSAAATMDALIKHDRNAVKKYIHLATAFAVVFDNIEAVKASRYMCLWGVSRDQFAPIPSYLDDWKYYTNPSNARGFGFALDKLPWPILLHLVDNDVSEEERKWCQSRYNGRAGIEKLYKSVPYDYEKLGRKTTKLGNKPYTLPNVLKYGGVCVDQAQFTTRAGKCLGIPAMKVRGQGRYGGSGHCWAGFLVITKGRPRLEFTGRYFHDYYYTGDVFDPQTGTTTMDRLVAMMYDGASLSYKKYNQSQMLIRIAEKVFTDHPEASLELTQKALKLNYFNMWGWPLLVQHIKRGSLDRAAGLKWFNSMVTALREHPDITFLCLNGFISMLPESELRKRQSLYNQAFALYGQRPDLQLQLKKAQAEELVRAGEKRKAINVLLPTVVQNSKEARLILPGVKMLVGLAGELGLEKQVYPVLKRAETEFPKKRGSTPSVAYAEFKKLLDILKQ